MNAIANADDQRGLSAAPQLGFGPAARRVDVPVVDDTPIFNPLVQENLP